MRRRRRSKYRKQHIWIWQLPIEIEKMRKCWSVFSNFNWKEPVNLRLKILMENKSKSICVYVSYFVCSTQQRAIQRNELFFSNSMACNIKHSMHSSVHHMTETGLGVLGGFSFSFFLYWIFSHIYNSVHIMCTSRKKSACRNWSKCSISCSSEYTTYIGESANRWRAHNKKLKKIGWKRYKHFGNIFIEFGRKKKPHFSRFLGESSRFQFIDKISNSRIICVALYNGKKCHTKQQQQQKHTEKRSPSTQTECHLKRLRF